MRLSLTHRFDTAQLTHMNNADVHPHTAQIGYHSAHPLGTAPKTCFLLPNS